MKRNIHFTVDVNFIDAIALNSLPSDGPHNVDPVKTSPDGNCMCRSLSYSYAGNESMHVEICLCIVEGSIHKEHYTSHECLSRGATLPRDVETLPYMYVTYSDHYMNGQRITENTVEYIYL